MSPKRIQMSRQHPWRADNPDAVIVARPSKWGNPFTMSAYREFERELGMAPNSDASVRTELVACFRSVVTHGPDSPHWTPGNFAAVLAICRGLDSEELADRDLACWCPLDQPCHADVLLELANGVSL